MNCVVFTVNGVSFFPQELIPIVRGLLKKVINPKVECLVDVSVSVADTEMCTTVETNIFQH